MAKRFKQIVMKRGLSFSDKMTVGVPLLTGKYRQMSNGSTKLDFLGAGCIAQSVTHLPEEPEVPLSYIPILAQYFLRNRL